MNNSNNLNKNGKLEPDNSKVPPALSNLGNKIPNMPKQNTQSNIKNDTQNNVTEEGKKASKNKANSASGNIKSQVGNMALGAAANQDGAVGAAARTAIKIKKIKTAWTIATTIGPVVLPILGGILVFLLICSAILIPTMYIGETINNNLGEFSEALTSFGDKFTNLITFNGFQTSSDAVSNKIANEKKAYNEYKNSCLPKLNKREENTNTTNNQDENDSEIVFDYNSYLQTPCLEAQFDEGILISTLQTNNVIDYATYDKNDDQLGNENYTANADSDFGKVTVDADEVKDFYSYVDSTFLGKSGSINNPSEHGLIWNLVDYKFAWQCVPNNEKASYFIKNVENAIAQFWNENSGENILDTIASVLPVQSGNIISNIVTTIKGMKTFKDEGLDYWDYYSSNIDYNVSKSDAYTRKNYGILKALWNSDDGSALNCGENYSLMPYMVKYMNYENYVNYLKEVYIPTKYFNCTSCKEMNLTDEAKEQITKDTITEILDQRNAYYEGIGKKGDIYLVVDGKGNYTIDGDTGIYNGGVYPVGTSGTGWKQGDSNWGSFKLASSSDTTMARIGCYVTSIATVIANSGTKINGTMFDPGVLASVIKLNGGFDSSGSLQSYAWTSIAPNFVSEGKDSCSSFAADCGNKISGLLAQGKFVVVNVPNHFVAVVGADEHGIIISDPAKGPDTEYLSKYNGVIKGLRVFHKTD